jgi:hypothetical protein
VSVAGDQEEIPRTKIGVDGMLQPTKIMGFIDPRNGIASRNEKDAKN